MFCVTSWCSFLVFAVKIVLNDSYDLMMLRESFQSPPSELLLSMRSVNLETGSIFYLFICIQYLSRF